MVFVLCRVTRLVLDRLSSDASGACFLLSDVIFRLSVCQATCLPLPQDCLLPPQDTVQMVYRLHIVQSEWARGKAWVRYTLREGTLSSYLALLQDDMQVQTRRGVSVGATLP